MCMAMVSVMRYQVQSLGHTQSRCLLSHSIA